MENKKLILLKKKYPYSFKVGKITILNFIFTTSINNILKNNIYLFNIANGGIKEEIGISHKGIRYRFLSNNTSNYFREYYKKLLTRFIIKERENILWL